MTLKGTWESHILLCEALSSMIKLEWESTNKEKIFWSGMHSSIKWPFKCIGFYQTWMTQLSGAALNPSRSPWGEFFTLLCFMVKDLVAMWWIMNGPRVLQVDTALQVPQFASGLQACKWNVASWEDTSTFLHRVLEHWFYAQNMRTKWNYSLFGACISFSNSYRDGMKHH